jgi:hypothetical protein
MQRINWGLRLPRAAVYSIWHSALSWPRACRKDISQPSDIIGACRGEFVLEWALGAPTFITSKLARNARASTSSFCTGFCATWVCISSSSVLEWALVALTKKVTEIGHIVISFYLVSISTRSGVDFFC